MDFLPVGLERNIPDHDLWDRHRPDVGRDLVAVEQRALELLERPLGSHLAPVLDEPEAHRQRLPLAFRILLPRHDGRVHFAALFEVLCATE